MARLLHVEVSPRKKRSSSITVGRAVVKEYMRLHPDDQFATWDLWGEPLPELDNSAIEATYLAKRGEPMNEPQTAAWKSMSTLFERFASADKLVISTPMWNFGMPYKLKQLIDLITLSGKAFSFSPEGGYEGLLTDRRVVLVYASGGEYADGAPAQAYDQLRPYLHTWLGFVGLNDYREILAGPTQGTPEQVDSARERALAEAAAAAAWL